VINDTSAQVEGVTEVGAVVTVNGVQVPVTGSGGFSTRVTLGNGTTTIVVVATDPMGNNRSTSVEVSRATVSSTPSEAAAAPDFLMLGVGLGAGVVLGLVLRGRRAAKPADPPTQAPTSLVPSSVDNDPQTAKGPRGPQPPGR
jgi:hypothetical protein